MILLRRRKFIKPIGGEFTPSQKAYIKQMEMSKKTILISHGVGKSMPSPTRDGRGGWKINL